MNLVFISPNFPTYYWNFCKSLRERGVTVLGVGDAPYDDLVNETKESLVEYYRVNNLQNYDEVYRAMGFFIGKYGRIDYIESQNEFWLELEAQLREDFNIHHGLRPKKLEVMKFKSKMKDVYKKANVPTARYKVFKDDQELLDFCKEVGFPIVVKPDNGVGASHTYRLSDEQELKNFLSEKEAEVSYIMEEFIYAEINSYDAIIDSHGEPLFETGNITPISIMDIVNNEDNAIFYILKDLPEDTRKAGRATVKSFGVKSRFVHFEFFRLTKDQEGLGKKGSIVALEVNMRPCGGFTPDMMNFAHSLDVYKIWADMIAFDKTEVRSKGHAYCAFAGRRDGKHFVYDDAQIREKYRFNLKMDQRLPKALAEAMGDQMYVALFKTKKEMDKFYHDILKCKASV